MKYLNQRGSSQIIILVAVVVVAIVGVAGYRVYNQNSNATTTTKSTAVIKSTVPSSIKSNADVTQATKALDTTNIDGTVNPTTLDSDLNAVL